MPRKAKEIEENKIKKSATTTTKKPIQKQSKKKTNNPIAEVKKTTSSKKVAPKKTSSKTNVSSKTKKKPNQVKQKVIKATPVSTMEYYDLPYRYNQTVVKILAQTPTMLFIYWDISDDDKLTYQKQFGENFFEITKPVLIIHNRTMDYSFEVEINDFANSWYLPIKDSKSNYEIELGRRPICNNIQKDYIYISSSNQIEAPNDHILLEKEQKMIYFKNVKNDKVVSRNMSNLVFVQNRGKIYNIYDFYQERYQEEMVSQGLTNPSSSNPTSTFK